MCPSSKSVDSCQQQREKSDDYLFPETVKVESVDQLRQSETEYVHSTIRELGLIKFIGAVDRKEDAEAFTTRIKTEYEDVFTGIGCLEKPYHIKL